MRSTSFCMLSQLSDRRELYFQQLTNNVDAMTSDECVVCRTSQKDIIDQKKCVPFCPLSETHLILWMYCVSHCIHRRCFISCFPRFQSHHSFYRVPCPLVWLRRDERSWQMKRAQAHAPLARVSLPKHPLNHAELVASFSLWNFIRDLREEIVVRENVW